VVLKKKVDWSMIKQVKNITMLEEPDIPTGVLRFTHGGLNLTKVIVDKEEEEYNTEESEEDNNSDGTRPHKVNTTPSGPPEGLVDVLAIIATAANVLPSTMPTSTIKTSSIEPGIRT
jgi:hypothetical protein